MVRVLYFVTLFTIRLIENNKASGISVESVIALHVCAIPLRRIEVVEMVGRGMVGLAVVERVRLGPVGSVVITGIVFVAL